MNAAAVGLYLLMLIVWYPLACGQIPALGKIQYALLFAVMALNALALLRGGSLFSRRTWHPLFLFYAVGGALLTALAAGQPYHALYFLPLTGTYLFAAGTVQRLSFEAFLKGLYIASVASIYLVWFLALIDLLPMVELVDDLLTFRGFYLQKNVLGSFLVLSLTVIFVSMRNRPLRGIDAGAVILGVAALYWTQSKTAIAVTALVAFLLPILGHRPRLFPVVYLGFWTLLAALTLGIVFSDDVGFYGWSAYDGVRVFDFWLPLTGRTTIWMAVLSHIESIRTWCFGFGSHVYFDTLAAAHFAQVPLGDFVPADAHNGYIDIVVNYGLVGLAFFFILLGRFAYLLWSVTLPSVLKLFASTFMIVTLVANLTESTFVKTTNIHVFLFWALLLYLEKERGKRAGDAQDGTMQRSGG